MVSEHMIVMLLMMLSKYIWMMSGFVLIVMMHKIVVMQ